MPTPSAVSSPATHSGHLGSSNTASVVAIGAIADRRAPSLEGTVFMVAVPSWFALPAF
jgi:hypothetical protein